MADDKIHVHVPGHILRGIALRKLEAEYGAHSMGLTECVLDSTDFCWFILPARDGIVAANDADGNDGGEPSST